MRDGLYLRQDELFFKTERKPNRAVRALRCSASFFPSRPRCLNLFRVLISIWLAGFHIASAQQPESLEIHNPSPGYYRIEYEPQVTIDTVRTAGREELYHARFINEVTLQNEPGSPIISYRALPVLLPSDRAAVQILETEFVEIRNFSPALVPSYKADSEFGTTRVPASPEEISRSGMISPGSVVTLVDIAPSGRTFAGTLRMYPVQVDPETRTAKVFTRIVVEIRSLGGTPERKLRIRAADSPLSQGEWYRLDVNQTGIQKLDWQFFSNAGISPGSVGNIQSIRIFGRTGKQLPSDINASPANPVQEITRLVVDADSDGLLGQNDYVLFYGQSANDWQYDSTAGRWRHYVNPFTSENSYLLTFGGGNGRPMSSAASGNDPSPIVPTEFESRLFVENDRSNLILSGQQWVGEMMTYDARSFVFSNALPGFVDGSTIRYEVVLLSRSKSNQSFLLEENNQFLGRIPTLAVFVDQITGPYAYKTPVRTLQYSGAISGGRSNLRITYEPSEISAIGWVDWVEIYYRRSFSASADLLRFESTDSTGSVEYRLSGFSARDVRIFDITDHSNVSTFSGVVYDPADPGKATIQVAEAANDRREYIATGPAGYRTPLRVSRIPNSNLLGITVGADFIIVSPEEFISQAQRLASHREAQDTLSAIVVSYGHILNEFAHGVSDPTALRNFLVHARATWQQPPRYVLLFGDGHYDYRSIIFAARNWIPPYESEESILQISTYVSDDYFVLLDPANPRISLPIGRFPLNSVQDAEKIVDKLIAYETASSVGPWRNRITFVADDGLTTTGDDGTIHTAQTEALAQLYTPNSIQKKKIYIVEYPTVNSASGRRKPDANKAIVSSINDGSLITNYIGHGNPQVWAHEWIFTREQSLPQLHNRDRMTFLVAATCDYARYDNPAELSAGEELIVMEEGGAVGVLTSSRAVYSFQNAQFNNSFYTELFRRGSDGKVSRLGDAIYRTKQIYYGTNDLKYHLLADPTMRLSVPPAVAVVDSVNGSSTASQIQIMALSKPLVQGEIRRSDGSRWDGFNGRVFLEVFDSKRRVFVPLWGNYSYEINGSILYRGELTVTDGRYQGVVPIPKDVSFDNSAARIAAYGWNNQTDASGYTENILIAGVDTTASVDTTGPSITVYLEDVSFRTGEVVPPDPLLLVHLSDENGINTSTAGIGHRLEARLDGSAQPISLSEYYQGDLDTYQSGSIQYRLSDVGEGRHTLTVKAWDTYNNSSEAEIAFEVRSAAGSDIDHVMNFPNPFSRSTAFTFQRPTTDPVDVEIRVYTVAGRLIHKLSRPSVMDRFVQVEWNGRDRDGNELANGVYFYKVIVRSLASGETQEVIGKLAVLR